MKMLDQLFTIPSTDPDDARRRQLLNILLAGMTVLGFLALLVTIGADLANLYGMARINSLYVATLSVVLGSVILFAINRYWSGWVAAWLFLVLLTVVIAFGDEPLEVATGRSLLIFAVPIIMASVLLQPYTSFIMAGLASLVITTVALLAGFVPSPYAMVVFFAIALVAWLSARSLERALHDVRQTNLELDQRVEERTWDLAEALAREHAESSKNQAILEGIADGVIVFDSNGDAIVANPAIGRILERASGEMLGFDIDALMADDVAEADQQMLISLLQEKELRRSSVKFEWGEKTLSVSFAPVRADTARVTGTVAVFRDFTREAEIDRMKSDFVSIVSHELRTPLTSMKGYLDLLLMGSSGQINKQQRSFLEIARDNAERLHELVSELLDISRIESGKIELDVQVVYVPGVIDHVAASLQKEFSDRNLSLTLDVPEDLPELFGDSGRISQIMTNLLSNAYKYTKEGGATIRARIVDQFLQIDVSDTGLGISEEDQEKLFTRFFRADDTLVRQQPGTGLGLSITKSLVEMHAGEIWVESRPGEGTTFSFTLPLPAGLEVLDGAVFEPETPVSRPRSVPEPAGFGEALVPAGPWVLVVDDDQDVANLFRYQLEREGYRVTVVTHGNRVLDVARQLQPELITLDLLMEVDGLGILRQLKSDPDTADIPVVVVSVVPETEKGLTLGAADYLIKPLDEGMLLSAVDHVLDQVGGESQDKILVVDDEIDIAGWLKHCLTHFGFHVTEAYDGFQALDAVAEDKPDLILLDMNMPRMDGRTTIHRLRAQEESRHIPIIVLSAYPVSSEAERIQLLGMGVKEFLKKPVTAAELVAEVKRHLGTDGASMLGT